MNQVLELKIGIVLNYKNAEKKKDELYCVDKYPWLKMAIESKYNELTILNNKKKLCVPADVGIGLFLESLNRDPSVKITVDYITPDDISLARFNKNDIVFVVIYDLLESFHLANKSKFEKPELPADPCVATTVFPALDESFSKATARSTPG